MFPLFAEGFDRVRGARFISVARSMWWDQGVVWCQIHASRGRHKPFERSKVMEEEKSRSKGDLDRRHFVASEIELDVRFPQAAFVAHISGSHVLVCEACIVDCSGYGKFRALSEHKAQGESKNESPFSMSSSSEVTCSRWFRCCRPVTSSAS